VNILNKQPQTADKAWSSSLRVEQETSSSSLEKLNMLGTVTKGL